MGGMILSFKEANRGPLHDTPEIGHAQLHIWATRRLGQIGGLTGADFPQVADLKNGHVPLKGAENMFFIIGSYPTITIP